MQSRRARTTSITCCRAKKKNTKKTVDIRAFRIFTGFFSILNTGKNYIQRTSRDTWCKAYTICGRLQCLHVLISPRRIDVSFGTRIPRCLSQCKSYIQAKYRSMLYTSTSQSPSSMAAIDTAAGTACTYKILLLAVAAPYTPATPTHPKKNNLICSPKVSTGCASPQNSPAARNPL